MGRVKVDIYKGEYEWRPVNLSTVESIKGLIKYRYRFDPSYNIDTISNIDISNIDIGSLCDEVICLYVWLDEVIGKCELNDSQNIIIKLYMEGYTEQDISDILNSTQQNVNGTINSICKKILEQNSESWLNDMVLWNYKKVDSYYKKCIKCGEFLSKTDKYYGKDERNKDGLQSFCKKCDSLRKKI